MKFSVVIWLICVFSFLLLIMLFGELPQFQGTVIAKLRSGLTLPFRELRGSKKLNTIEKWWRFSEPYLRWLIPMGYIALISACFYIFLRDVYPELLRDPVLPSIHTSFIIPVVISLPYISATLAIFSDPGYINNTNHGRIEQKFPYDEILFMKGNECVTCKKIKPARSKHCGTCNVCIAMTDHHCIFLNKCIGYYTIRWFLFFVASNSLMLGYGFYVLRRNLSSHVAEIIQKENGKEDFGIFNYLAWVEAILEQKSNGALMLLAGTLFIVATAFLGEHIKYIYLGVTTNETLKWEDFKECMDDGTLYFYDHPTLTERKASHLLNERSIVLQKLGDNGFNRTLTEEERARVQTQGLALKPLTSFDQINNIYDLGFWKNLELRLFPPPL